MFTTIAPFTLRALIVGFPNSDRLPNASEHGAPAQREALENADGSPTTWPVAGLMVTVP
jgi:hypothetical protein